MFKNTANNKGHSVYICRVFISVGDQVQPGDYKLHSKFERVLNYAQGGRFVSVVHPFIGAGPDNLIAADLSPFGERLHLDALSLAAPRFDSKLPKMQSNTDAFQNGLKILEKQLFECAAEKSLVVLLAPDREHEFKGTFEKRVLEQLRAASQRILQGEIRDGLRGALGLGWGLTPCGDDFVAGVLMAFGARGLPLVEDLLSAPRGQVGEYSLSRHMLLRAAQGRVVERWRILLGALEFGADAEIAGALKRVLEIGQTSGADTATGFLFGMRARERGV